MPSLAPLAEQTEAKQMPGDASALAPAWLPSHGPDRETPVGVPSGKIRNVETAPGKRPDNFGRLRESWLGRVYIGHLKPYAAVRWVVQWLWRHGYPIYVNQLATRGKRGQARRWRRLTPLREFATKPGVRIDLLVPASRVETPAPRVFPAADQAFLESPHTHYEFPEIVVATLANATTYGGSNLVLVGRDDVVCHDLYDFARDYTSEELHGRTLISPRRRRIRWLLNDEQPEIVPLAATFVDACAANYAHWLTEVLPRIVLFCADERFKDVPLVVNGGLHDNIMESLLLVAGTDREIITLGIGRALTARQLHFTAAAGYVPFGRRSKRLSGHSHGVFSPPAFEKLRRCLTTSLGKAAAGTWPEKIFIRRASGPRMLTNTAEIERLLVARGYAIIQPEALSFTQQLRLFANARIVVSPTGAALANAIFCQPGTQVGVFMAKHEEMIYRYWCDMLTPLQIGVSYVLGNIVEDRKLGIHGNFVAATSDVVDLLEALEKR